MEMNSEEQHTYFVWYILNKINKKFQTRTKNTDSIIYSIRLYPASKNIKAPNPIEEQQYLVKLSEMGLFQEIEQRTDFQVGQDEVGNPKVAGMHLYLKINELIFNKFLQEYNQKIKDFSGKNTLFFSLDGSVKYISPAGKIYHSKFKENSTSYKILTLLIKNTGDGFVSFDEIAQKLSMSVVEIGSTLSIMGIKGLVTESGGKYYLNK